eukprot:3935360-Rhodomonas_salina.1
MDFTPEQEDIMVWANAAYLAATEKTMEEFTGLKASQLSKSMRELNRFYYEQTQVKLQPDRFAHTMYPKKGPWKLYFITRPFRLIREGKERVVIFVDLIPVREDEQISSFRPLEELFRYTNVIQLMIDCKSFEVVTGNPCAQYFYKCAKDFVLMKDQRRLHMEDIFASCAWDTEEQRKDAWDQVSSLTLSSVPVEMEVRKLKDEKSECGEPKELWHKIVWVPAVNPATGLDSLMVSEYDISELKQAGVPQLRLTLPTLCRICGVRGADARGPGAGERAAGHDVCVHLARAADAAERDRGADGGAAERGEREHVAGADAGGDQSASDAADVSGGRHPGRGGVAAGEAGAAAAEHRPARGGGDGVRAAGPEHPPARGAGQRHRRELPAHRGRPQPPHPDPHQPRQQRHQVHGARLHLAARAPAARGRTARGARGGGHGPRHPGAQAREHLGRVRAGELPHRSQLRRRGPRPLPRAVAGGGARGER